MISVFQKSHKNGTKNSRCLSPCSLVLYEFAFQFVGYYSFFFGLSLCTFFPELFQIHTSLPPNISVFISSGQGMLLVTVSKSESEFSEESLGSHTAFICHVAFISVHPGQFPRLPFKLMAWASGEFRPAVLWRVACCGCAWRFPRLSGMSRKRYGVLGVWSPLLLTSAWPNRVRACLPGFPTLKSQFYHL